MSKSPSEMTAGEVNARLDRLERRSARLVDAFIRAGRGMERPSDYAMKTDPLSLEAKSVAAEQAELRGEVARRYGPGAPHRLPRGFGPVRAGERVAERDDPVLCEFLERAIARSEAFDHLFRSGSAPTLEQVGHFSQEQDRLDEEFFARAEAAGWSRRPPSR